MSKTLITRTDDFGSARAANQAILKALKTGNYVRNVSCMAVAPCIEADAMELEAFRKKQNFCIGLHATINSEWEQVKYHSILNAKEIPSLVDEGGVFTMHPMFFQQKMPQVSEVIREISAQLDYLTRLGLTVEYMDTHMLPEVAVHGMMEALSDFADEKGLVDQRWYYTFAKEHQPVLEDSSQMQDNIMAYEKWYDSFEDQKQYINILHPAEYSQETKLFYNMALTGDSVARSRDAEQRVLNSRMLETMCRKRGISLIKYTEALPQGDTTENAALNF